MAGQAAKKILITGASGHLGANLMHRLVQDGNQVRVFLMPGTNNSAADGLDVERVYGDLRDASAVDAAVKGCARVFHTAAKVSTIFGDAKHKREIYDSNVTGTRSLLDAAVRHGVEKVVVTGSFSATGFDHKNPSLPANEEMRFYPFDRMMPYEASKTFVEFEVMKAALKGLPVCIATSCAIIGPHDYLPSRMGRALCDFSNGKLHAYIDGGFEFVAARDIVQGHLLTMEKGRPGEKYIFATQFLTLPDIMEIWEAMTGRPRPRYKLPVGLMSAFAEVASPILTRVAPNFPQRLTPGAVRILQLRRRADLTKAKTELGYQPTSIRSAFAEAYDFHAQRGAIHAPNPNRVRWNPASSGNAETGHAPHGANGASNGQRGHAEAPAATGGCPVAH